MASGDRFAKEIAVFEGAKLNDSIPKIQLNGPVRCYLPGTDRAGQRVRVGLDDDLLSKHLMFFGGIGTGKSNALYHLVGQLRESMRENDVMLIFDSKGDFLERFKEPDDVILSNDAQASGGFIGPDYWNIFGELEDDEHLEANLVEIARTLFYEKLQNSKEPFFPNAAKDLFFAILYYYVRSGEENNNEVLRAFFDLVSLTRLKEELEKFPELTAFTSYISAPDSTQSQGVFSELQQLAHEVLLGNFRKSGNLSIRQLIRAKGARVIFLEYDLAIGNMLTPIYRLLFDLAIKEALSRKANTTHPHQANVFLIADEFRLLPFLQHIDNAVNFGRSLGVKFMIGVQNVEQIYAAYGAERARSILSGFSTRITFRLSDGVSRRYIEDVYGRNRKIESYLSTVQTRGLQESVHYANVVEDWDITTLKTGDSIISFPETEPFFFHFDEYRL